MALTRKVLRAELRTARLLECSVLRNFLVLAVALGAAVSAGAQKPSQPQVKVNMLNVCAPSAEDQKAIASALARVPKQPLFGVDFEVDRGESSLDQSPEFLKAGANSQLSSESGTAKWVRIRREFSFQALFSTVQYSFSQDTKNMVETLVFRVRDPKDLLQVSIEDRASAVTAPSAMLTTNTPASHVKLERFGKSSVVLARCPATEQGPAPDQSAFEPLFQAASGIVGNYRRLLGASRIVPDELARVEAVSTAPQTSASKSTTKKPVNK